MADPTTYDETDPRERALVRRRLVAAIVTVLAMTGIAGGSAYAAVAGSDTDQAGHTLVVRDAT